MAAPRVVLHIGLHKTATRFLQRAVFASLDSGQFLFNPRTLRTTLREALRRPGPVHREQLAEAAAIAREEAGARTLLVSDPDISGNMFDNHSNYRHNLELIHEVFPEAMILYFVRRQSDWLHSAYRQALVKGRAAPIEVFLNFRGGSFHPRIARRTNGVRIIDALGLRFLEIYFAYAEAYGAGQVYLFRQEDLRARPGSVYPRLAEALGVENLPPLPERVSGNRAFSALALDIFFPGTRCMPDWSQAIPHDDPPDNQMWRLGHPLRKLRTLFIRHVFDRVIYRDRDLLSAHGIRAKLDEYYAEEEERIGAAAEEVLDRGPGRAALAAAGGLSTNARDILM